MTGRRTATLTTNVTHLEVSWAGRLRLTMPRSSGS